MTLDIEIECSHCGKQVRRPARSKFCATCADLRQDYHQQKHMAKKRGIAFNLTFVEWLEVWTLSGYFAERGRANKRQYVMSRPGDKGAYEIGNVKIVTMGANSQECFSKPRTEQHKQNISKALKGKPKNEKQREKFTFKGRKHSEETKRKMRASAYRRNNVA